MLKINNLEKNHLKNGKLIRIFNALNLEIKEGEFVTLFGPNGCGKTTLLNLIAGLEKPTAGEIAFRHAGKVAFIFQNYRESLFPWLSVKENIAFPLKLLRIPKSERNDLTEQICKELGIKIDLESFPYSLSGGQQQLVAILRALIIKPKIILLDEPFSSLDYQTTLFLYLKIQEIWTKTNCTIIFISHEIDEAVLLSQRLILFSNKPTMIVKEILNVLPYPRPAELMGTREFAKLKQEALSEFIKQVNN